MNRNKIEIHEYIYSKKDNKEIDRLEKISDRRCCYAKDICGKKS